MKKITITLLLFLFTITLFGAAKDNKKSKIIENPPVGAMTSYFYTIKSVELTDTTTILNVEVQYPHNWWVVFGKDLVLATEQDTSSIKWIKGLEIGKKFYLPESGRHNIVMGFEPLNRNVKKFDVVERSNGGTKTFDVDISGVTPNYMVDNKLFGEWCLTDGSGIWELGLYPNFAIYKNKFWTYKKANKRGQIALVNRDNSNEELVLYYKSKRDGTVQFGESSKSLKSLSKEQVFNNNYIIPENQNSDWDQKNFIKPGKAVIKGYLSHYSPRLGFSRGGIIVRNTLINDDRNFLIEYAEDGTFESEVELPYPMEVLIRVSDVNVVTLFLSPGDTITTHISLKELSTNYGKYMRVYPSTKYMGESGLFNTQHDAFLNSKEYYDSQKFFRTLDLPSYQKHMNDRFKKEMAYVDRYIEENKLLPKVAHFIRNSTMLEIATSAYDYKDQRGYYVKDEKIVTHPEFYSLTKELPLNDKTLIALGDFYFFINRLEYFDGYTPGFNLYTEEEYIKEYTGKMLPPELAAFKDSVAKQLIVVDIEDTTAKTQKYLEKIGEINKYYNSNIKYMLAASAYSTIKRIEDYVGIERSFTTEVVALSSMSSRISYLPNTNDLALPNMLELLSSADLIKHLLDVVEENRETVQPPVVVAPESSSVTKPATSASSEPSVTEGTKPEKESPAQLLSRLLEPYRGNIIILDYWAMWCGPCRAAMQDSYLLKDRLKDNDVAFVYFTTERDSPTKTREKFIEDNKIEGHFITISRDEWTILTTHYNINGIPHYMLIDKKGNVIEADFKEHNVDINRIIKLADAN